MGIFKKKLKPVQLACFGCDQEDSTWATQSPEQFGFCHNCQMAAVPSVLAEVIETGKLENYSPTPIENLQVLMALNAVFWAQYNQLHGTFVLKGKPQEEIFAMESYVRELHKQNPLMDTLKSLESFGHEKFGDLTHLIEYFAISHGFLVWRLEKTEEGENSVNLTARSSFAVLNKENLYAIGELYKWALGIFPEFALPTTQYFWDHLKNEEFASSDLKVELTCFEGPFEDWGPSEVLHLLERKAWDPESRPLHLIPRIREGERNPFIGPHQISLEVEVFEVTAGEENRSNFESAWNVTGTREYLSEIRYKVAFKTSIALNDSEMNKKELDNLVQRQWHRFFEVFIYRPEDEGILEGQNVTNYSSYFKIGLNHDLLPWWKTQLRVL